MKREPALAWNSIDCAGRVGGPLILLDEVSGTGCLDYHCIIWFVRGKKILVLLVLSQVIEAVSYTAVVWLLIFHGIKQVLRSLLFWDVTQRRLIVTDGSWPPVVLIFKGQAV